MRVFVTGATGYIGSAVVSALVRAGHQVTGLVRSPDNESALKAAGAAPLTGSLEDPAVLRAAAVEHDASVHAGFRAGPDGVASDRHAIQALLEGARGAGAPRMVVYTSGVLCVGTTGDTPLDEGAPAHPVPMVAWRPAHERLTLDAAGEALATAVIRPGFVYGGWSGVLAGYFASATAEGAAAFVGDGRNRMALVHRDDLAELYRMVLEQWAGGLFHGVDGAAPRVGELARAASAAAGRGGATRSLPLDEARKTMGPFAEALCTDQVVVTSRSPELGWTPAHPPALDAMEAAFAEWCAARAAG